MTLDTHPRLFSASQFARALESLHVAPAQRHGSLWLWPLLARTGAMPHGPSRPAEDPGGGPPPCRVLADAVASGTFVVSEVGDLGAVPHVIAENRGDRAVLVVFGEELRGAKQNRIANASFLVGARSRVVLDVSCVEAGRWSRHTDAFAASGVVFSSASRRKMARRVADARDDGRGFVANQSEVWDEIEEKLRRSGAPSETRAYADHLHARLREIDAAEAAFARLDQQVGFVAAVDGRITGLEVLGRPELFARLFRGLLGAYLVDALDHAARGSRAPVSRTRGLGAGRAPRMPSSDPAGGAFDDPEAFLRDLVRAPAKVGASIGLGEDVRLRGFGVEGCALFAGGLVHLTAFPSPGEVP